MKKEINQELTRENIKRLRESRGYTQEELAELVHGSRTYYTMGQ